MSSGSGRPAPGEPWGASAVRLSYDGTLALDNVSVTVAAGRVTAVVGGDGAGKTSLLRCLAGVLRPDVGQVRSPGKSRIGFLPASSGIYPDLTVAENLAFRASSYGLPPATAARRTAELTEQAGLAAARDRLAANLSGGMRQKLGVIAALLHQPELLILDEPSTGVDPVSRSGLWWLIASAAADGAAVILSTTYLDDAQRSAEVLVLDAGRPLAYGTPEQIVGEMPGSVRAVSARPTGPAASRAWRRGCDWRVWTPETAATEPGVAVEPDLQDAVIAAALARHSPMRHSPVQQSPPVQQSRPVQQAPAGSDSMVRQPAGPLVESISVTCRFGSVTAVRDVSIAVSPGEIVGLLGANGAGKTTLIRMLLGLIPPTAGQVWLLGEPPSRLTRRRIGYVPQGLGLYEDLTAAENMAFARAVFGNRPAGVPAQADPPDALGHAELPVGQLPLGLQRRVAFAQALAHQPDVLILDEPTSGVDALGRTRLWQTIAAAVESGAGALVSTHYMEEADECDRLIIMADGAVVAAGTARQIIGDAQVTVVEAEDWAAAFGVLKRAGLQVALAGRGLRVPGASPDEVRQVLPAGYRIRAEAGDARRAVFRPPQRAWPQPGAGVTPPARKSRSRTGRRSGDSGSKTAILGAAKAQFAEHGYDGATIRAIAAAAGVDPALVHHFYGSKERLFAASMELPIVPSEAITAALARREPGSSLGTHMVRSALALWEGADMRDSFQAMLRSALTSEQAAATLRDFLTDAILAPVSSVASGPDPDGASFRASLVAVHMLGLAVSRYVLRIGPVAHASQDELAAAIGPAIDRYLTGDIS